MFSKNYENEEHLSYYKIKNYYGYPTSAHYCVLYSDADGTFHNFCNTILQHAYCCFCHNGCGVFVHLTSNGSVPKRWSRFYWMRDAGVCSFWLKCDGTRRFSAALFAQPRPHSIVSCQSVHSANVCSLASKIWSFLQEFLSDYISLKLVARKLFVKAVLYPRNRDGRGSSTISRIQTSLTYTMVFLAINRWDSGARLPSKPRGHTVVSLVKGVQIDILNWGIENFVLLQYLSVTSVIPGSKALRFKRNWWKRELPKNASFPALRE